MKLLASSSANVPVQLKICDLVKAPTTIAATNAITTRIL